MTMDNFGAQPKLTILVFTLVVKGIGDIVRNGVTVFHVNSVWFSERFKAISTTSLEYQVWKLLADDQTQFEMLIRSRNDFHVSITYSYDNLS